MSGSGIGQIPYSYELPFEIALGSNTRFVPELMFGENQAVGATDEDIWNVGGFESLLTAAETMNIASDDPLDTVLGDGAQTITVYGLDNDYLLQQETISLNGVSVVSTINSYIRVYRMTVRTAGVLGSNQGTITCTSAVSGFSHAAMIPTYNATSKSQYTVPADKKAIIASITYGSGRNDEALFKFYIRPFGEVFQLQRELSVYQNSQQIGFDIPVIVEPRGDIVLRAERLGMGGDIRVAGVYQMYLFDA